MNGKDNAPRILIVEDAAMVALGIRDLLERLGFIVSGTAMSGLDAIQQTGELKPDLVLMDIQLRGAMDGVMAAERIRTRFDIPIVYLTAFSDDQTLERAKVTEPFGYILKPVEPRELHVAIEMALYKHQAEKRLKDSEARYRAITELTSDFAYSIRIESDGNRAIEWVTDVYTSVTGFTPEETEARGGWNSLVHPDDRPLFEETMQNLLSGHRSVVEFRITNRTGDIRWIRVHGVPVWSEGEERVVRIYGAVQDFTERKYAEQGLKQRNRELELLNRAGQAFNSTLDLDQVLSNLVSEIKLLLGVTGSSVWLIDAQTKELFCREASGSGSEILRGWRLPPNKGIAGWVAQHGKPQVIEDAYLDERHIREIEEKTSLTIHSVLSVPLKGRQQVIGVLQVVDQSIGRFKTSDVRLMEALAATATIAIKNSELYEKTRELQQQTQQDAETKALLLREVNHRVSNNLTAIIGLLSLERNHLAPDSQAAYGAIRRNLVSRVQSLATVHNLLSASRWAPLRLCDLIRKVVEPVLQTTSAGHRVTIDTPSGVIRVTPDQAHNLALVLNELTINATKYAYPNSENCLRINILTTQKSNQIQLEYRDNGPGYPEEMLKPEEQQHSVGFELIKNIIRRDLRGILSLHNDGGAVTTIQFEAKANQPG